MELEKKEIKRKLNGTERELEKAKEEMERMKAEMTVCFPFILYSLNIPLFLQSMETKKTGKMNILQMKVESLEGEVSEETEAREKLEEEAKGKYQKK